MIPTRKIPVLRPTVVGREIELLSEVLDSGWWGLGPKTAELEVKFAKHVGAKHAIALSSGTAALDLALKVHKIQGGELICPALTFVACAMVGAYNGMRVRFADVRDDDLCVDVRSLPVTSDTKAVIVVHLAGALADVDGIRKRAPGALIIEDCAHANLTPGAGRRGDIAAWSFQAVKTMPAGDGGMLTFDDEALVEPLKALRWCGVSQSTWQRANSAPGYAWDYAVDDVGYKCYMNDLTAAIALAQLEKLPEGLARRRAIAEMYRQGFAGLEDKIRVNFPSATVQYCIMRTQAGLRDHLIQYLAEHGIVTSVHFKPLHLFKAFAAVREPLPVAERAWQEIITLPCHLALTDDDVAYVIETAREALRA